MKYSILPEDFVDTYHLGRILKSPKDSVPRLVFYLKSNVEPSNWKYVPMYCDKDEVWKCYQYNNEDYTTIGYLLCRS